MSFRHFLWPRLVLALGFALSLFAGASDAGAGGPLAPVFDGARSVVEEPPGIAERIVNGLTVVDFPSVALYASDQQECSATLIGCRTVLTAAHCVCTDYGGERVEFLNAEDCIARPDLVGPADKWLLFHHGGLAKPEGDVVPHPDYDPKSVAASLADDLAIIRLAEPVWGVRPSGINRTDRLPAGTAGLIVGFGRTHRDLENHGIKRAGEVVTVECGAPVLDDAFVCFELTDPLGPPGEEAGLCFNDSGGPLFTDFGSGLVVAGVAFGGVSNSCQPPSRGWEIDVFLQREWIEEVAGDDLGTDVCGGLAPAFEPGTRVAAATGFLSASEPRGEHTFEVPPGTRFLRVTLNGAAPAANDFDLFLRRGAPAAPENPRWYIGCWKNRTEVRDGRI